MKSHCTGKKEKNAIESNSVFAQLCNINIQSGFRVFPRLPFFFKEKTGKGCKKSEDMSDEGKKLSNVTSEQITVWSHDIKTNEKIAPLNSNKNR